MAALSDPDIRARRNVRVLVAAQAILGAQMPVSFVLGGLAGQYLSPIPCLATLPISLIVLGSMLSAPVLAHVMQARGRRLGFVIGAAGGAVGAALTALALWIGSFPLMLAGSLLSGLYMSAQGFYRFAATDTASAAYRPKAISYVMAGGLLSAILGPQIVKLAADAMAPVPFAGAYVAVVILNAVGVFIFAALDIPVPTPVPRGAAGGRTRAELLRSPTILVPLIAGMVAYALMNLVMTSTPLAVVGCGFSVAQSADVVTAHVLAMFVPSFFTGHLIARFGAPRVIATGLVLLAAAGVTGLLDVTLGHFYVALVLLGLGWNFGYIGATAMVSAAHAPEERARVQGMNDFFVFGLVTIASLSSGLLMNCSGGSPVEGWAAVNYAMLPFLAVAGAVLVWRATRDRTA